MKLVVRTYIAVLTALAIAFVAKILLWLPVVCILLLLTSVGFSGWAQLLL